MFCTNYQVILSIKHVDIVGNLFVTWLLQEVDESKCGCY